MATNYDLLIYRDFTDTFDSPLAVGDRAERFGEDLAQLHVVALGPPIHQGKDRTIVLAHNPRPMPSVQNFIERPGPAVP